MKNYKAPPISIIDPISFELQGFIKTYFSFRFTRKLWEIGQFELHVKNTEQNSKALKIGNIIFVDEKRAGLIDSINITEKDNKLVAKGKELKGITSYRIVIPDMKDDSQFFGYDRYPEPVAGETVAAAPAESVFKHYVNKHLAQGADPNRQIENLVVAPDLQRGGMMSWSSRFDVLSDVLKKIGDWAQMGYCINLDLKNKQMVFDVIPQKDSTAGGDSPVIFSSEYNNLTETSFTVDDNSRKNVAYVGGAGSDEDRAIKSVVKDESNLNSETNKTQDDTYGVKVLSDSFGQKKAVPTPKGLNRRETWIDAGSIDDMDELEYEGQYRMQDMKRAETVDADILNTRFTDYLDKWDLGSVVTVRSKKIGYEIDKLITEVQESYESNGTTIRSIFGERKKNIIDKLQKEEVVR